MERTRWMVVARSLLPRRTGRPQATTSTAARAGRPHGGDGRTRTRELAAPLDGAILALRATRTVHVTERPNDPTNLCFLYASGVEQAEESQRGGTIGPRSPSGPSHSGQNRATFGRGLTFVDEFA